MRVLAGLLLFVCVCSGFCSPDEDSLIPWTHYRSWTRDKKIQQDSYVLKEASCVVVFTSQGDLALNASYKVGDDSVGMEIISVSPEGVFSRSFTYKGSGDDNAFSTYSITRNEFENECLPLAHLFPVDVQKQIARAFNPPWQ